MTLSLADVAISVGSLAEDADRAIAGRVHLPASAPLEDLGPFIFGDHPLHLEQQLLLRLIADLVVEEDDLDAAALELLDEEDLISIFASQAIGRVDVEAIDQAGGRLIAEAFQGGPDQHGSALPLIDEAQRILHSEPILADSPREGFDLTADRVLLGLLIRRDAGIDRGPDRGLIHGDVPPEGMRRARRVQVGGRPEDPPSGRGGSPGGPPHSPGDRPSRAIDPADVKVGSYDELLMTGRGRRMPGAIAAPIGRHPRMVPAHPRGSAWLTALARAISKTCPGNGASARPISKTCPGNGGLTADFHGRENNQSSYGCRGQW